MSIRYLLDTHALIWASIERSKLGARARRIIESASPGELAIPAPVVIELGRFIQEDIVDLKGQRPSEVFGRALNENPQIPVTLSVAIAAPALGLAQGDPYDRLIVATARELDVPLITKDGHITDSGLVRVIW